MTGNTLVFDIPEAKTDCRRFVCDNLQEGDLASILEMSVAMRAGICPSALTDEGSCGRADGLRKRRKEEVVSGNLQCEMDAELQALLLHALDQ